MTREEAIEVLKKTVDNSVKMTMREWEEFDKLMVEAVDMAIEALSAEPSGDLISRADVIEAITNFMKPFIGVVGDMGSTLNAARELIKELPSADAEKPCKTCGYYNLKCPKDCEHNKGGGTE